MNPEKKSSQPTERPTIRSPSSEPRMKEIFTKNGPIPVQLLRPIGDDLSFRLCALTQQYQGYPEGTQFLHDHRLEKETRGAHQKITHKMYEEGSYSLARGLMYSLEGYGVFASMPDGEFGRLSRDAQRVLECSLALRKGALSREDEPVVLAAIQTIQRTLKHATDSSKRKAHADAARGTQLTDRRGRRNVSAATLSLGAMVHQLQIRKKRIASIDGVYRDHLRVMGARIDEHIVPVLRLWGALQESPDLEKWGFLQGVNMAELEDHRMALSHRLMQELQDLFSAVVPLSPFHTQWSILLRELQAAKERALADDRASYLAFRRQMVHRANWMLLRYMLEMNVIAKLGMIIRRLERKIKDQLVRTVPKLSVPVDDLRFHFRDDPEGFREVKRLFGHFHATAKAGTDRGFVVKFRQEVLRLCEETEAHMRRNDWRTAKKRMKQIAALL